MFIPWNSRCFSATTFSSNQLRRRGPKNPETNRKPIFFDLFLGVFFFSYFQASLQDRRARVRYVWLIFPKIVDFKSFPVSWAAWIWELRFELKIQLFVQIDLIKFQRVTSNTLWHFSCEKFMSLWIYFCFQCIHVATLLEHHIGFPDVQYLHKIV